MPSDQGNAGQRTGEDLGTVMGGLARTMQEEHGDVQRTLQSITRAAVLTVPGTDWASISPVSGRGVTSEASTDDRASQLDSTQRSAGTQPMAGATNRVTVSSRCAL